MDYWKECVSEAFEDAGISATTELLSFQQTHGCMFWEATIALTVGDGLMCR